MKPKHLLALIPIIGASVLLWGQPHPSSNLLHTNAPSVNDLLWRSTNTWPMRNATKEEAEIYRKLDESMAMSRISAGDKLIAVTQTRNLLIGDWPTNIVISNDYSGTIQIGSNFATVKELDTWMSVLGSMKRYEDEWTKTNSYNKRLTYTVDVANGLWTSTNVIDIHRCSEYCTRMRYVENGLTNDFHAAFVSYTVKTNAP